MSPGVASPQRQRHGNSLPRNDFGLVSPKTHEATQATPGDTRHDSRGDAQVGQNRLADSAHLATLAD
jgi:hypothetical protein